MSLHDVDMGTGMRTKPALNVSDGLAGANRMAHGTLGVTLVDQSSDVVARVVLVDGKVEVYNSSGVRIGRIGVRETDTDGAVDVAKPGQTL